MNNIEKLDNVTWYGHCVIHVVAAINDLPNEAKLILCRDLERFIRRQHRELEEAAAYSEGACEVGSKEQKLM